MYEAVQDAAYEAAQQAAQGAAYEAAQDTAHWHDAADAAQDMHRIRRGRGDKGSICRFSQYSGGGKGSTGGKGRSNRSQSAAHQHTAVQLAQMQQTGQSLTSEVRGTASMAERAVQRFRTAIHRMKGLARQITVQTINKQVQCKLRDGIHADS